MDALNTNNTTDPNSHTNTDDHTKNEAMKQFYFIITVVFIILLVFIGFFIYNLIKCYLPKWKNKKELVNEDDTTRNIDRRIEFEEI